MKNKITTTTIRGGIRIEASDHAVVTIQTNAGCPLVPAEDAAAPVEKCPAQRGAEAVTQIVGAEAVTQIVGAEEAEGADQPPLPADTSGGRMRPPTPPYTMGELGGSFPEGEMQYHLDLMELTYTFYNTPSVAAFYLDVLPSFTSVPALCEVLRRIQDQVLRRPLLGRMNTNKVADIIRRRAVSLTSGRSHNNIRNSVPKALECMPKSIADVPWQGSLYQLLEPSIPQLPGGETPDGLQ